jgi:hypothetical protein
MGNMSYCEFENTSGDLKQCINSIYNKKKLSQSELSYLSYMIKEMYNVLEENNLIDFDNYKLDLDNLEILKKEMEDN